MLDCEEWSTSDFDTRMASSPTAGLDRACMGSRETAASSATPPTPMRRSAWIAAARGCGWERARRRSTSTGVRSGAWRCCASATPCGWTEPGSSCWRTTILWRSVHLHPPATGRTRGSSCAASAASTTDAASAWTACDWWGAAPIATCGWTTRHSRTVTPAWKCRATAWPCADCPTSTAPSTANRCAMPGCVPGTSCCSMPTTGSWSSGPDGRGPGTTRRRRSRNPASRRCPMPWLLVAAVLIAAALSALLLYGST
jgi:hypothetical protein